MFFEIAYDLCLIVSGYKFFRQADEDSKHTVGLLN